MEKRREIFNAATFRMLKKSISAIVGTDIVIIELPSFNGFRLWWKGNDKSVLEKLEHELQVKLSQVIYDEKLKITFCAIDFVDNNWLINP